jgi:hypothetical protein
MKNKTIVVFDWSDIKSEICKEMGIKENLFRDYHNVIGGDYKDLWHEWLNYFNSELTNDSIQSVDLGESAECKIEWVKEDGKDWLEPFINAVYKVWEDNEIEYVSYSW